MKKIADDIKNGTFSKAYLLYGEETYLRTRYRDMLCDAIAPSSDTMNRTVFSGDKTDAAELMDLGDTFPMFADKRLIIVKDSGFFKKGSRELADYIREMPDYLYFVFSEDEVDKKTTLYKALQKEGYVCEFKKYNKNKKNDAAYLENFALKLFAKAGKKIRKSSMALFIDRVGDDMNTIANEAGKLISFCHGREEITKADIEAVTTERIDTKVYNISDKASAGDIAGTLEVYRDLIAMNEAPMRILAALTGQFQQLIMIRAMSEEGSSTFDIASEIGRPEFAVRKMLPLARRSTMEELVGRMRMCVETDESIKTGLIDDSTGLEVLLAELCR